MSKNLFKNMTNDQTMAFLEILSGKKIDDFLLLVRYQFSNDEISFLINLYKDIKNYDGDMSSIKKKIKGAYKLHPHLRNNMVKNMNEQKQVVPVPMSNRGDEEPRRHHPIPMARRKFSSASEMSKFSSASEMSKFSSASEMSEFDEELDDVTSKIRFGKDEVRVVENIYRDSPSLFDKEMRHRRDHKYRDLDYHSPKSLEEESSLREEPERSAFDFINLRGSTSTQPSVTSLRKSSLRKPSLRKPYSPPKLSEINLSSKPQPSKPSSPFFSFLNSAQPERKQGKLSPRSELLSQAFSDPLSRKDASPKLPENWVKARDHASGRTYYRNIVTEATTWNRPA
jgi:hypothetical protein